MPAPLYVEHQKPELFIRLYFNKYEFTSSIFLQVQGAGRYVMNIKNKQLKYYGLIIHFDA